MSEAGTAAARLLAAAGPYWVHLDVDVLDEAELPATDYLLPGGLTFAELGELMQPLVASPRWVVDRLLQPREGPSRSRRQGAGGPSRLLHEVGRAG